MVTGSFKFHPLKRHPIKSGNDIAGMRDNQDKRKFLARYVLTVSPICTDGLQDQIMLEYPGR